MKRLAIVLLGVGVTVIAGCLSFPDDGRCYAPHAPVMEIDCRDLNADGGVDARDAADASDSADASVD